MYLSFGKKIFLALLAVALLPLLSAGIVVYRLADSAMKKEVLDGLSALSVSTFEHFVDYVDEKEDIVNLLARTQVAKKALEDLERAYKDGAKDRASFRTLMERYREIFTPFLRADFSNIYLLSREGDVLFSLEGREDLGRNLVSETYKGTELANVFRKVRASSRMNISELRIFPPTGKPAAFIAAPIMKGGKARGVIAFKLDTKGLYRHLTDYTGLGMTGEICLGTRLNGKIVFAGPLRHDPAAAFRRTVTLGSPLARPLQYAVARKRGSGIVLDYRGKKTVAVWRYFEPLHLGFVVKQDVDEAFAPVAAIRRWALIIGGITVIFVMFVSAVVAKSVSRPIKRLQDGVERVGRGDLSHRVGTDTMDEIGQLSRAVDAMTENLSRITASRDELDREIAVRKKAERDMRKSEERLREYSRNLEVMVDRRTAALRDMQRQLIQKERLAAIGQLASSIGHELRNPLGVIGNSVYYLRMKLKAPEENIEKHLDIMDREIRRTNRIISDLLDFSKARVPQLQKGDINDLVRETLLDLQAPLEVRVKTDLGKDLPLFLFDPDQVRQLLVNLINNAYQAMDSGGRLLVRTALTHGFVEITVQDTGPGIPEKELPRIFEPLYSTRAKGTGLGLSIVKGIVERHGGFITVESRTGEGATFRVRLPIAQEGI